MLGDHVLKNGLLRIPYGQTRKTSIKLLPGSNFSHMRGTLILKQRSTGSVLSAMNKLDKLGLGAKILRVGVEKLLRQIFSSSEGEQLLKASQYCLSSTAGPIQGHLFISTHRLTFCSDRPIAKCKSPIGKLLKFHYKMIIPLNKMKKAGESKDMEKTSQKYLQVMTTNDFEFWFMGFLNYKRTFKSLQQAVSKSLV
ncbi:hypothetical protein Cgig2_027663 [Carnegiea gigantea]|uniref:GRAM domain-containing protein n=1 Tax=Carnegiea gigantea TaxID=171969 RepID=A0A9Q1GZD6_9CARY|nr:hypothetical protein Cgig2_027663 [Carnegiea gigantea]